MTLQHKKVSRQIMLGVSTAPWKCCCRILFFSIIENMIANMEVELWTEIVYLVNYPGFEISEFGFSVLKICVCHQFDEKCIIIGIQTLLIFILVKSFLDYNFLSVSYFNLSFGWNLTSCFTNSIECNYIQAQDFWFTAASIFRSILWKKVFMSVKVTLWLIWSIRCRKRWTEMEQTCLKGWKFDLHVNTRIAPQIFLLIDTLYDAPWNKLLRLWQQSEPDHSKLIWISESMEYSIEQWTSVLLEKTKTNRSNVQASSKYLFVLMLMWYNSF